MNNEEFEFTPINEAYGKLNPDCLYPKCIFNDNEPNIYELVEKLQQENNQLKEQLKGVREEREYLFNKLSFENQQLKEKYLNAVADYETTKSENQRLHNKIDKAIGFIEDYGHGYDCTGDVYYCLDEENQKELLEILKESE